MKHLTLMNVIMLLAVTLIPAEGQSRTNSLGSLIENPSVAVQYTDLGINQIYSDECACALPGLDVFYMKNIKAVISRKGVPVKSTLKVTYYGVIAGKEITMTKELQSNDLPGDNFIIVNHPVLVKRSKGIRVEITPNSAGVLDGNKSDNLSRINDCKQITVPVD